MLADTKHICSLLLFAVVCLPSQADVEVSRTFWDMEYKVPAKALVHNLLQEERTGFIVAYRSRRILKLAPQIPLLFPHFLIHSYNDFLLKAPLRKGVYFQYTSMKHSFSPRYYLSSTSPQLRSLTDFTSHIKSLMFASRLRLTKSHQPVDYLLHSFSLEITETDIAKATLNDIDVVLNPAPPHSSLPQVTAGLFKVRPKTFFDCFKDLASFGGGRQ